MCKFLIISRPLFLIVKKPTHFENLQVCGIFFAKPFAVALRINTIYNLITTKQKSL